MRSPKVCFRYLRKDWNRNGWEPTDTGWLLTISIVLLVQALALPVRCAEENCSSKLEDFFELKPSEMGDTLAGLFSALAFIWIIVTVFLQSRELREQRKEFREQRVATQEMAQAMKAQAQIFLDEKRQRNEKEAAELFDQLLSSLDDEIRRGAASKVAWTFSTHAEDKRQWDGQTERFRLVPYLSDDVTTERQMPEVLKSIEKILVEVPNLQGKFTYKEIPERDQLSELKRLTDEVLRIHLECPGSRIERYNRMQIGHLGLRISQLLTISAFWKEVS